MLRFYVGILIYVIQIQIQFQSTLVQRKEDSNPQNLTNLYMHRTKVLNSSCNLQTSIP
jgi:hypothetical protein